MTPRPDLDAIDELEAAFTRSLQPPDFSVRGMAARGKDLSVILEKLPALLAELRAARAVVEAARPLTQDRLHVETKDREGDVVSCDGLDRLSESITAYDAVRGGAKS